MYRSPDILCCLMIALEVIYKVDIFKLISSNMLDAEIFYFTYFLDMTDAFACISLILDCFKTVVL